MERANVRGQDILGYRQAWPEKLLRLLLLRGVLGWLELRYNSARGCIDREVESFNELF